MKLNFKTEYLFIGAIILVVLTLIILIILSFFPPGTIQEPTPVTKTSPTGAPPATPTIPSNVPVEKILNIIRSAPPQSSNITYNYVQPIEITFNNEVRPSDVRYTVIPQTDIEIKNSKYLNSIVINPVTTWKDGKTTIIIIAGSKAQDGSILYQPFTYEINTATPTDLPERNNTY